MSFITLVITLSIFSCAPLNGVFAGEEEIDVEIHRLSERLLVLTDSSPMKLNVTAIASEAGIVVVDTTDSTEKAQKIREIIEREFDRSDFAYVINTHHHGDHWFGNPVFSDATIIAHDAALETIRRIAIRNARNEQASQELTEIKKILPTTTFSDRLSINLGDMTLNLYYYGQADTTSSIVLHVPEEKLFCAGDLYWPGGAFSNFDDGLSLNVPKWIEVLNVVLVDENSIENVVCGHKSIWPRRHLELRRDYIVDLWNKVKAAKAEGLTLEEVKARFPSEKFSYLDELQFDERLREMEISEEMAAEYSFSRRHIRNVEAFWRRLQ